MKKLLQVLVSIVVFGFSIDTTIDAHTITVTNNTPIAVQVYKNTEKKGPSIPPGGSYNLSVSSSSGDTYYCRGIQPASERNEKTLFRYSKWTITADTPTQFKDFLSSATGSATGATGSATGATGSATGATGSTTGATGSATGATGSATGATGSATGATGK